MQMCECVYCGNSAGLNIYAGIWQCIPLLSCDVFTLHAVTEAEFYTGEGYLNLCWVYTHICWIVGIKTQKQQ